MNTCYTFKKSAIEKIQHWELTDGGISFRQEGKADALVPYQHISSIKVSYKPFRFRPNNYSCIISAGAVKTEIFSTSYENFGKFSDLRATYTPFVKELVHNTRNANPFCQITAGQSHIKYYGHLLLTSSVIAMLLILFSFIPIVGGVAFTIKMLLIGYYIVYIFKSFYINVPHNVNGYDIPPKVLPNI